MFSILPARQAAAEPVPSPPDDLVVRAIDRMARIDVEPWSYRRVLESAEGRRVDRHEPGPDPARHWVLESIDGRPPTDAELDEYRETQEAHGRRSGENRDDEEADADAGDADPASDRDGDGRVSPAERVAGWFAPGSFATDADDARTYRFRLRSPDGRREHAWAQMEGELHVAGPADDPWVDRARLWNTEPFFAAFGVRMTSVSAEVAFERVGEHVHPLRLEVNFSGRAWLVRELDERLVFTFDDWRRAGAETPPVSAGATP